jgi:hypothetical protein
VIIIVKGYTMAIDLGTNKIRDDLKGMEDKFDVGSYLNKSEASKFVSELPGIKDLITAIENIVGEITTFANKLLGMLNELLAWLNLNKIFDALGINKLLEFIFDLVDNGLFGFGLPADLRNDLLNLFKDACIDLDSSDYTKNSLESFALSSLLIALACSGYENTFSTTLDLYKSTPDITEVIEARDVLVDERALVKDVPEYYYDEEDDEYKPTIDNSKLIAYDEKIAEYNNIITTKENSVDRLFANTIPKIFIVASSGPIDITNTTNTINDIASTSAGRLYGNTNSGLSKTLLAMYDGNGITQTQQPVNLRTGTRTNIVDRGDLMASESNEELDISPEEFNKLESSIAVLDSSFDNTSYYASTSFKGTKRKGVSSLEVESLEPGQLSDTLTYCI